MEAHRAQTSYLYQCSGLQLVEAIGACLGGGSIEGLVQTWGDRMIPSEMARTGKPTARATSKADDTADFMSALNAAKARIDGI